MNDKKSVVLMDGEIINEVNENLSLIEKTGGLRFSTDAYLLAAFAKPQKDGLLVDLGSGTGIIPMLCLARDKYGKAAAIEIQPDFVDLISRNAELNGLGDRITPICADARQIKELGLTESASVVTANPPYMKATHGFASATDAMTAARREEHGGIADFASAAASLLKYGGLFYAVYTPERLADLICALRDASLEVKKLVTVYPDAKSKPCLVLVEAKKGASAGLVQSPPLIIYDSTDKSGSRRYTEEMQMIYDSFSLDHLFR